MRAGPILGKKDIFWQRKDFIKKKYLTSDLKNKEPVMRTTMQQKYNTGQQCEPHR